MSTTAYIPKLTHEERAERRLEMAAAVESGKRVSEVAIEFEVTVSTVAKACEEFGIRAKTPRGRKPGLSKCMNANSRVAYDEWVNADWTLRDVDLSLKFGVSRERVRQVRKAIGKSKPKDHHLSALGIEARRWLDCNRDLVSGKRLDDVAALCPVGLNRESIKRLLDRMQIPYLRHGRQGDGITKENLQSLCDVTEKGCWEFSLKNLPTGYACLGGKRYVHRMAYRMFHGEFPADGWICHTCDNPKCVNPEHLYLGDAATNARDRAVRGRDGMAKLTPENVVEIRRRYAMGGTTMKALSERFGVEISTIYSIISGKTWKHLDAQLEWKRQHPEMTAA